MNEPFQHPLDKIYPNNSLLILEAMIPYVDPSLKLPLAMLIKIQELRILMQILSSPSRTEACGLNRGNGNTEELLNTLCRAMGFDFMEQMNTINNMQNMMNTMNAMQTMQSDTSMSAFDLMKNMPDFSREPATAPDDRDGDTVIPFNQHPPQEETREFASETKSDMIDAIRQILSEQEGEPYES